MNSNKGFVAAFFIGILFCLIIGISVVILYSKFIQKSPLTITQLSLGKPSEKIVPTDESKAMSASSVFYYASDKSINAFNFKNDLATPIDSFDTRIYGSDSRFLATSDRKRLFYVKTGNIWMAEVDAPGKYKLTKLTTNVSIEPPFDISLIGVDLTGEKLLYAYQSPPGMNATPDNPLIRYGLFYMDMTMGTEEQFISPDQFVLTGTSDFAGFAEGVPVYMNNHDGHLYSLELSSGKLRPFGFKILPALTVAVNIDPKEHIVYYSAGYSSGGWAVARDSSTPDSYSQILGVNYLTGEKTKISPEGVWAEYQYLSVSPKFTSLLYGKQTMDYKKGTIDRIDFFHYNIASQQTRPISLPDSWGVASWLDEKSFAYVNKKSDSTVYKYNLETGVSEKLLDNVSYVVR